MKRYTVGLIVLLLLITLFSVMVYLIQGLAMFHPNHTQESWDYWVSQTNYEAVEIKTADKSWHGLLRHAESDEPTPLILFFYGNGDNAAKAMHYLDAFEVWPYFKNYQCLIIDYDGYGLNDGQPSEKNMYEMALEAYDYASELPHVSQVIVGGYSLGTGSATYLAAHREIGGLFLMAPYANGYDLCNSVVPVFYGPLRLLVRYKLQSDEYAKEVTVPALVVASRDDEVIPFASSERLYNCFKNESTLVTLHETSHGSVLFDQTSLDSIKEYLETQAADKMKNRR